MDDQIKPYDVHRQRLARRAGQHQKFTRNQAIGLLLIALVILIYRLLHTPSGWLFTPGWWRLW